MRRRHRGGGSELVAARYDADDLRSRFKSVVAGEPGRVLHERSVQRIGSDGVRATAGRPRTFSLSLHLGLEASLVDGEAVLLRDLACELDREAECVVQVEGVRAGDRSSCPRCGSSPARACRRRGAASHRSGAPRERGCPSRTCADVRARDRPPSSSRSRRRRSTSSPAPRCRGPDARSTPHVATSGARRILVLRSTAQRACARRRRER